MSHNVIRMDTMRALEAELHAFGIYEREIQEKFIHSGGPGGQHVNKVATCVYLKHLPTGLEVKCQQERSQALNRFFARRLLLEKIKERVFHEKSERQRQIEKIRRQKRRRLRRTKEKVLAAKRARAEIKQGRTKVHFSGADFS